MSAIELSVAPEPNPAPDASSARPGRVITPEDEERAPNGVPSSGGDQTANAEAAVSTPAVAPLAAATGQTLTALHSDDIFRMKELRTSESISASEVADASALSIVNGDDGNEQFATEENADGSHHANDSQFNPAAAHDDSCDLNEEDLFRMKSLSLSRTNAERDGGQSVTSQVDSASNYEEQIDGTVTEDANAAPVKTPLGLDDPFKALPQTDLTFCGNFVFNRNRRAVPQLNPATVVRLDYPFDTLSSPPAGVNREEYERLYRQSRAYVVGTAHFSVESQNDVRRAIAETQPDLILVELCPARMAILSLDEERLLEEARSLNREKVSALIREHGLVQGLLQVMLLSTSAHITRQLKMAPGGEFRAAHRASFSVQGCRVILGDRPISITLKRALSSLGFFQQLRLIWHILSSNLSDVTQEDVERCKDKDLLETLLAEMAGEFPSLSTIFVTERDQFMTHMLHTMMQKYTEAKLEAWRHVRDTAEYQPLTVVAVVGIGHMSGIASMWNKHIDPTDLCTVPSPSRTSRVVRFVIKATAFAGVAYAGYRFGRFAYHRVSAYRS